MTDNLFHCPTRHLEHGRGRVHSSGFRAAALSYSCARGAARARSWLGLGIGVLLIGSIGCTGGRGSQVPQAQQQPLVEGSSAHEVYRAQSARSSGSEMLFLPGSSTSHLVHYQVVDGMAVVEGDVVLGPAQTLRQRFALPWPSPSQAKGAVAVSDRTLLWPHSEIPYEVAPSAQASMADIRSAIEEVNQTSLKLRPRTSRDADYVVFSNDDQGCWSYLGRVGGAQPIQLTPHCQRGSVIHEILHAAGFLHEQSRNDRDQHVRIVWDEISPSERSQFETRPNLSYDLGPYDYASILHYGPRAFSRSGRPTIVPRVEGVTIGQREGLSELDRAAIEEVYGGGTDPVIPTPSIPVPVVTPSPVAPAPAPPPASTAAPASSGSGSFAGTYASEHGTVVCQQEGQSVQCRFDAGALMCVARDSVLDCGWTGSGVGRATFTRRQDGKVEGTWGDAFSNTSRGGWTWVPTAPGQGGATAPAPTAPAPTAPAPTAPTPPSAPPTETTPMSLSGSYESTRGPMTCSDNGTLWSCSFQEPNGVSGRLDCSRDATGTQLTCTWATFLPNPAAGRAVFTRSDPASRELRGTWGYLHATEGGGAWNVGGR